MCRQKYLYFLTARLFADWERAHKQTQSTDLTLERLQRWRKNTDCRVCRHITTSHQPNTLHVAHKNTNNCTLDLKTTHSPHGIVHAAHCTQHTSLYDHTTHTEKFTQNSSTTALGTLAVAGQTASLYFTWNFLQQQQQLRSLQQGAAVHLASQPASQGNIATRAH